MIRLLVATMCLAAIRTQVSQGYLYSPNPSGGNPSPLYNLLTSPYVNKCQVPQNPPPTPCAPAQQSVSPPAPRFAGVPTVSGIVLYSPNTFQQTGPATVIQTPPAVLVPPSSDSSTHIMTIPRKASDFPLTETYTSPPSETVYTSPPDNSLYQPPPPPPITPPRQVYYTRQAPLLASCPATVFYPQPVSYSQPPVFTSVLPYSVIQPAPATATCPVHSALSRPLSPPQVTMGDSVSSTAAAAQTTSVLPSSGPPADPKTDGTITYTLLSASSPTEVAGIPASTSLEAENKDCSIPVTPSLV